MRKREERFNWLNLTPAQQLHVIKLCRQRYRRKMLAGKTKPEQLQDESSPQQDLF
ncbi:predicted Fe-S protein [Vibrio sp. JCM 19053]|nr:predicted Fe-S protein [Vibrio sp. JCM 19053]